MEDPQLAGAGRVEAWDEISGRKPNAGYSAVDLLQCWIVYASYKEWSVLRSSTIAAIDRQTGRIVYQGMAGDEG